MSTSAITAALIAIFRPLASFLLTYLRLFGWGPFALLAAFRWPRHTALLIGLWFSLLSRFPPWVNFVRKFASFAIGAWPSVEGSESSSSSHSRFRLIKSVDLDPNKTFILAGHPHGILSEGVVFPLFFDHQGMEREFPGFRYCAVGGSQLGYLPLYREIFNAGASDPADRKICPPDKKSILNMLHKEKRSIGIFPGGFSEAVFSTQDSRVEYCYIKGRMGFVRLAIECGVDIVPVYSFGVSKLYQAPKFLRGFRARLAQTLRFPMIPYFFGKWFTAIPDGSHTVYTVIGKPFPTSTKYSLDQVEEAHRDYCIMLKEFYDDHKGNYGEDRDLVFIGKDYCDNSTEFPQWSPPWKRMEILQQQLGKQEKNDNLKQIQQSKARNQKFQEISSAAMEILQGSGNSANLPWTNNPIVRPPKLD